MMSKALLTVERYFSHNITTQNEYKGTKNPYVILAEDIGIRLVELLDCRSKSYKSLRKLTYLLQM